MLVGNRVGVGSPCSPFNSQLREQVNNVLMVVSPLWRGPVNIHDFILQTRVGYWVNTNYVRRVRCVDNNVDLMRVQPHYHCARQVEP